MINRPVSEVLETELGNYLSVRKKKTWRFGGFLYSSFFPLQKHTKLIQSLWNKPEKTCPTELVTLQKLYSSSLDSWNCLVSEKKKSVASTSPHCWGKKTVACCLNSAFLPSVHFFSFWVSDQWKYDCDMRKSISNIQSCMWAITDFIIAVCRAAYAVAVIIKSTDFKASHDYHRKNTIWFCNPHLI